MAHILRSTVGVEYRVVGERVVAGGHLQRVDDQVGAHVLGQGVADARLGVAVDHCGQIQPAFPGRQVGDVSDELGAGGVGVEVAGEQVRDHAGVAGDGGGGPERAGLAGDQAQLAHDRAEQFRGEALALAVQGGMDPAVPVGVVGVVEDPLDEGGQAGPAPGGRRGGPVAPLVEARGRHAHPRAHFHDLVARLLGIDERELRAHRYSWAKKAAAFPRNSAFIFSSRFSRSSSRSRARSEIDSGGSSPAWSSRYLWTQFPRVPSFTWISRATSATGRDDSITIFTASSLNSGVNFLRRSRIDRPPFRAGPYWVRYPESGRLASSTRWCRRRCCATCGPPATLVGEWWCCGRCGWASPPTLRRRRLRWSRRPVGSARSPPG